MEDGSNADVSREIAELHAEVGALGEGLRRARCELLFAASALGSLVVCSCNSTSSAGWKKAEANYRRTWKNLEDSVSDLTGD